MSVTLVSDDSPTLWKFVFHRRPARPRDHLLLVAADPVKTITATWQTAVRENDTWRYRQHFRATRYELAQHVLQRRFRNSGASAASATAMGMMVPTISTYDIGLFLPYILHSSRYSEDPRRGIPCRLRLTLSSPTPMVSRSPAPTSVYPEFWSQGLECRPRPACMKRVMYQGQLPDSFHGRSDTEGCTFRGIMSRDRGP